MDSKELIENVKLTYEKGMSLLSAKSWDYATNDDPFKNFRGSALITGISVEEVLISRIVEKVIRVENLLRKTEVKNESINDSIYDLCNFSAILKAYLDSQDAQLIGENLDNDEEVEKQLELPLGTGQKIRDLFGWK